MTLLTKATRNLPETRILKVLSRHIDQSLEILRNNFTISLNLEEEISICKAYINSIFRQIDISCHNYLIKRIYCYRKGCCSRNNWDSYS
jgi:hypothetical protein